MRTAQDKLDPIIFAVIKAKVDGTIREMAETVLRTARNPILNRVKDFTCSILTYDGKLLSMANSLPIHLLSLSSNIRAVAECFKGDIHAGDYFANNDPYHGNNHVGDWVMSAPIFYKGEFICWSATLCHLIDTGAHIPTSMDPLAKDVYEEAMHFPPLRMGKDYKEIPEIIRFIRANFRYPDQWYGDFLAQVGSLFVGEREVIKLCEKYGSEVIKRFQDELLDYGDRRMTEEIKKLPKGTWFIEALSEKIKPIAPEGLPLKLRMSIDPDQAVITFDLTEMPDQLPWGYNLTESTSRGACIQGTMPSLDPTLPRNDGVFRHFNIILREGAVAGIPKWPAATSIATVCLADEVTNMVFRIWEQVEPGRGHAGGGLVGTCNSSIQGSDFRHHNALYGHVYFVSACGGPASKGCDGWPTWVNNACMGNMYRESVELAELSVPVIIWEVGIQTDSAGAGQWRGGAAIYHKIQPRHHTFSGVPCAMGHTDRPAGVAGGKDGCLADHWTEKHATSETVQQLDNVSTFQVSEEQDWVCLSNGGGGYGNPLERDPEAVRDDARNYIVSIRAARDEYGVVLNAEPELYEVDYEATKQLRAQLIKRKGVK